MEYRGHKIEKIESDDGRFGVWSDDDMVFQGQTEQECRDAVDEVMDEAEYEETDEKDPCHS